MKTDSGKKQNRMNNRAATWGDAIDQGLWRLSLVLREIAESTITRDSIVSNNPKLPAAQVIKKALQSKKEVNDDDNVA